MTRKRPYQLLCPIAQALDVVGDRWTLLILRDLHAGPARFQQLQEGLGIATNLLTTRLAELTESGMIRSWMLMDMAPTRSPILDAHRPTALGAGPFRGTARPRARSANNQATCGLSHSPANRSERRRRPSKPDRATPYRR